MPRAPSARVACASPGSRTLESRAAGVLRMSSSAEAQDELASAPLDAAADAPGESAPASKRGPACAPFGPRGDGPFFGPATGEAVSAQLLLTAGVVAILSVAGDAHGSATKARAAGRGPRAPRPDARPPNVLRPRCRR